MANRVYRVWMENDGPDDGIDVEDMTPGWAAAAGAERIDSDSGNAVFDLSRGADEQTVMVRDPDGKLYRVKVTAEATISYSDSDIDDVPPPEAPGNEG